MKNKYESSVHNVSFSSQVLVQIGNPEDKGCYAGQVVLCDVHAFRETRLGTSLLVSPVGKANYFCDAVYVPQLHEAGETNAALYATNSRTLGYGVGGEWDIERIYESLNYKMPVTA